MKNLTKIMQTLVLAILLTFFGCENVSTEPSVSDCIVGTFGNNKPEFIYPVEYAKNIPIENLERTYIFRKDGTGSYFKPGYKLAATRPDGDWNVSFKYSVQGTKVKISVTSCKKGGLELSEGVTKEEFSWRISNVGLFKGINDEIDMTCNGSNLSLNKSYAQIFNGNSNGVQLLNESDIKPETWIRRN
jgi:hypothetical protein